MAEIVKKTRSAAKAKTAVEPKSTDKLNGAHLNGAAEPNAAKPRKTAAKKNNVVEMAAPAAMAMAPAGLKQMAPPVSISHEQVAQLAHRLWFERGCGHGHHEEDWLRAEEQLRGKAS